MSWIGFFDGFDFIVYIFKVVYVLVGNCDFCFCMGEDMGEMLFKIWGGVCY